MSATGGLRGWSAAGAGAGLGASALAVRATVLARLDLVGDVGVVWGVELFVFAASLALWLWSRRGGPAARPVNEERTRAWAAAAVLTVLGGGLLRTLLFDGLTGPLPSFDAPAHATIAQALAMHPASASWEPFMDAPFHYPWGAHAAVVMCANVVQVPIHQVCTVWTLAGLGMLSIVAVGGLGAVVWPGVRHAGLASALVYGFLTDALGLMYGRWGGFASEYAMLCAVGLAVWIWSVADRREDSFKSPEAAPSNRVVGVFVALGTLGVLWSHHLSPAIVVAALGVPVLTTAWTRRGLHGARPVGVGVAVAALAAAPMWIQVLSGALGEGSEATSIPRHMELLSTGARVVGPGVLICAVWSSTTPSSARARLWMLSSVAGLVLGFVAVFSLTRWGTFVASGGEASYGMLVPTRWLAALGYPLSAWAGGGLGRWLEGAPSKNLRLLRWALAWWIGLGTAGYEVQRFSASSRPLEPAAWQAHASLGARVGAQDLVVSITSITRWAGYLTRVTSNVVPAPPGSDPLTSSALARRALARAFMSGVPAPTGALRLRGGPARRVFVLVDQRIGPLPERDDVTLLEHEGPFALFEWHVDRRAEGGLR